ncbi:hypothetical protein ACIQY5_23175 [Peribacillus frigoritolerans]|uniref:hypothetical protein n=1 Tax=Peribacillus frigoritolerans TaxID=450367 RepID=UPI003812322E
MVKKILSLLVTFAITFSLFSSSTIAFASQEHENEEILFEETSDKVHFNSVENDNFIISTVTDAERNQITSKD